MTTLPGISPWRLRIRRETDGIAILQAKTYVQQAVLPDTLFGQPVIRLGNRQSVPTTGKQTGKASHWPAAAFHPMRNGTTVLFAPWSCRTP